eukprot:TRINITY_DN15183_c0_g1_i1.p1 TRINITY_DN15183_c0_g1~~TRINITY_DN15183_c0_g1_i1.p1  ORF type:complete len:640 (-),score=140.20 TRINITY_DN15183_c0_g1_i1:27-1946(-)
MRIGIVNPRDARIMASVARVSEEPDQADDNRSPEADEDDFESESACSASEEEAEQFRASAADVITSGFFTSSSRKADLTNLSTMERMKHHVKTIMKTSYFDALVGSVMLFDVFLMISDVDARANREQIPLWMEVCSGMCLACYTLEFALALFANGFELLKQRIVVLDSFVLLIGYADAVLIVADVDAAQIGILRIVRVLRMMRMLRTARHSPALKELRRLVMMLGGCMRILLWSSVFLLIVQTLWSVLAVEVLQPIMTELIAEGFWSDCDLCQTSFSSVMRANLTFFKTIVAGDSWGLLAEPIIVRYPWCSLIFAGSLLSLVFGVMNLVVAVVVDTAAEQRQKDVMSVAQDLEDEQQGDLEFLTEVFKKIDEDGSGELELDELIRGAEEVPEFQSRLRVMDIDKSDLLQLFYMIDTDGGGSISPDEFKHALNRWIYDSKTATRFIKYNVMKLGEEQRALARSVRKQNGKLEKQLAKMMKMMKPKSAPDSTKGRLPTLHVLSTIEGTEEPSSSWFDAEFVEQKEVEHARPDSCASTTALSSAAGSWLVERGPGCSPQIPRSLPPVLLEAAKKAEHAVLKCLETAYQALSESALATAEASLQDAAAKALVPADFKSNSVDCGMPRAKHIMLVRGKQGGKKM